MSFVSTTSEFCLLTSEFCLEFCFGSFSGKVVFWFRMKNILNFEGLSNEILLFPLRVILTVNLKGNSIFFKQSYLDYFLFAWIFVIFVYNFCDVQMEQRYELF